MFREYYKGCSMFQSEHVHLCRTMSSSTKETNCSYTIKAHFRDKKTKAQLQMATLTVRLHGFTGKNGKRHNFFDFDHFDL